MIQRLTELDEQFMVRGEELVLGLHHGTLSAAERRAALDLVRRDPQLRITLGRLQWARWAKRVAVALLVGVVGSGLALSAWWKEPSLGIEDRAFVCLQEGDLTAAMAVLNGAPGVAPAVFPSAARASLPSVEEFRLMSPLQVDFTGRPTVSWTAPGNAGPFQVTVRTALGEVLWTRVCLASPLPWPEEVAGALPEELYTVRIADQSRGASAVQGGFEVASPKAVADLESELQGMDPLIEAPPLRHARRALLCLEHGDAWRAAGEWAQLLETIEEEGGRARILQAWPVHELHYLVRLQLALPDGGPEMKAQ